MCWSLARGGMKMQRNEAGAPSFDVTTKEESALSRHRENAADQRFSRLPFFENGRKRSVIDETGLTGAYNFTLEYTPAEILTGARYKISLFDALQTQLGLKLWRIKEARSTF